MFGYVKEADEYEAGIQKINLNSLLEFEPRE